MHSMSLDVEVVVLITLGLALDDDMLLLIIIVIAFGVLHLFHGGTRSLLLGDGDGIEGTTSLGRRVIVILRSKALPVLALAFGGCGSLGGMRASAGLGRGSGVAVSSILCVVRVPLLEGLLDCLGPMLGYGQRC